MSKHVYIEEPGDIDVSPFETPFATPYKDNKQFSSTIKVYFQTKNELSPSRIFAPINAYSVQLAMFDIVRF